MTPSIKKSLQFTFCLAISILITSCYQVNLDSETSLDGTWLSIGYGRIVQIESGEFLMADITSHSCTAVLNGEVSIFGARLKANNDTLCLEDGINMYYFTRIDSAPNRCKEDLSETKKNDPLYNFEVLGEIFSDHYAYFELRNINWDSLYNATQQNITAQTTDAELYIIMEEMLDSFNDGHIGISATEEVEEAADALRTSTIEDENETEKTYGDLIIAQLVAEHYLKDNLKHSRNKVINWGIMKNNIGYLQVNVMFGHADLSLPDSLSGNDYWRAYFSKLEDLTSEAHTRLELAGINQTLDLAMADLKASDAIILDVRFNGGGKDEVALALMSRFNSKRHLAFTKKARFQDRHTRPIKVYLESTKEAFTKPVYVLTSGESASATEIMILSSLPLDHVTRVGANSEGVFSDVLDKVLPNEWEIGLSNEVYLDTEGNNYEGIGIAPDIRLDYSDHDQTFFRSLANDLEVDKSRILDIVTK